MKVQEVLLRAMAKKIAWWQAAEIIGVSARTMRRWRERLEQDGYDGWRIGAKGWSAPSASRWKHARRCWACTGNAERRPRLKGFHCVPPKVNWIPAAYRKLF